MTSPALNGQKETSKTDSNVTLSQQSQQSNAEPTHTPFFVTWWRIFKLANLLMKPSC